MTFKVGDRVRVVNGEGSILRTGDIGEVVLESSGDLRLWIESRDGLIHYWVRVCDVELVPPPITDTDRLRFLAGCGTKDLPAIEELGNVDEDFLTMLIDVMAEKNRDKVSFIDATDDEKLEAFRRLIDKAMEGKP